jgi:hypothetical protein
MVQNVLRTIQKMIVLQISHHESLQVELLDVKLVTWVCECSSTRLPVSSFRWNRNIFNITVNELSHTVCISSCRSV